MTCSKWFFSSFWHLITLWQLIQLLKNIFYFHKWLDSFSNDFPKVFFNGMFYNKHYLFKASSFCIINTKI